MASEISSYMDTELFDAYNEGREEHAQQAGMEFGVWSAILDETSCDFCAWADGRTFAISEDHLMPPAHFGCRCIISYYTADMIEEDDLEIEQVFLPWDNPPNEVFPIGRKTSGKN